MAKADWNRPDHSWRLNLICRYRECVQADGTEAEKDHDDKLLVMPYGLARRFVLAEYKELGGR